MTEKLGGNSVASVLLYMSLAVKVETYALVFNDVAPWLQVEPTHEHMQNFSPTHERRLRDS